MTIPRHASEQTRSAEALVVGAAVALTAFYYLARADTIGVLAGGRAWAPMTVRPLSSAAHFVAAAVLLGVFPLALATRLTRKHLSALGLGLGHWRQGLLWMAVGVPLAVLAGKIGAASPALRAVYPLYPLPPDQPFAVHAALQFLYFAAWEMLFRGVLLFGLKDRIGGGLSNAIQTALSVVAHFGRALDETAAALPAGLVFGWVDLRVGSIWYVAVIHWAVGVSVDWFIMH